MGCRFMVNSENTRAISSDILSEMSQGVQYGEYESRDRITESCTPGHKMTHSLNTHVSTTNAAAVWFQPAGRVSRLGPIGDRQAAT